VSDYLRAHPRHWFWEKRALKNTEAERALFPGAMALGLAAAALVPPLGVVRVAYAAALLLMVELSRGANGFLYPVLYEWLPFIRGLRSPARASLFVGLALAVLAGFTVRRLLIRRSGIWPGAVLVALTGAVGLDLLPALALQPVWRQPPAVYGSLAGANNVVLAEFPMGLSPGAAVADTPQMYFSFWHWAQLINGYSGHGPEGLGDFLEAMRTFPDVRTIQLLRSRGTTHVTVNCALYAEKCDELVARMDAAEELELVTAVRWEGKPVRLYKLLPSPTGVAETLAN
jgi:hypothetical protein